MHKADTNKHAERPRLAAYAALLALALFQLGFATHQADHAVTELGETCAACAHYNDADAALAPAEPAPLLLQADPFVPAPPALARAVTALYSSPIRAPPAG
jgi:siderophore synthetase component